MKRYEHICGICGEKWKSDVFVDSCHCGGLSGGTVEKVRTFDTGATRDTDENKLDYEGFLSPQVLRRYAEYMHKHRVQAGGALRDSDNWQKGIPMEAYMKSAWRHFMDVWMDYRINGGHVSEDALCALLFNVHGMLFEMINYKQPSKSLFWQVNQLVSDRRPYANEMKLDVFIGYDDETVFITTGPGTDKIILDKIPAKIVAENPDYFDQLISERGRELANGIMKTEGKDKHID